MEWQITDAQSLSLIDQEIGEHAFGPAKYEVIRRVILATGDYEYKELIHFSEQALLAGTAALAARTVMVVDGLMVQAGLRAITSLTFANPVYCAREVPTRPSNAKSTVMRGVEALARRHPEAIFILSEQTTLSALQELVSAGLIKPTLVIYTPASFIDSDCKDWLKDSGLPYICTRSSKGNAVVSVAITQVLIELAWQIYRSVEEHC